MDRLEDRTQEIGGELLRRVRAAADFDGAIETLQDRWVGGVLHDRAVKTALFRLVDVLPVLRTPKQINRHLKEYLGGIGLAKVLKLLPARAGGALAEMAVGRMAKRFIAAADIDHAAGATRDPKLAFTIDLLGEAVLSETEADEYARLYRDLIDKLCDRFNSGVDSSCPRVNVSIKLSSLFSQFDPIDPAATAAAVCHRLRPILHRARRRGAFVCFDMEQFAFKDTTLFIFKQILIEDELRDWPDVGIAMQAYLKACENDLIDLSQWAENRRTPVWVRLVKGAYWDSECVTAAQNNWPVPVFTSKAQTDANFERLTEFLISNYHHLRPAIATHNLRSIAHALALAEQFQLPARTVEFQLLRGMAPSIQSVLVDLGQRVRLYAPVGNLLPGMAYLVRRLLENTSNESFLRSAFLEHVSDAELLMNPLHRTSVPPATTSENEFHNEPPMDFSREEARQSMKEAIANAPRHFADHRQLAIGGRRLATAQWIESINPSHKKQVIGHCAKASDEDAKRAVNAASEAFDDWREKSFSDRAELLLRVAKNLRKRRLQLSALEVIECGKPWREADADVAEAIDFCVYYAHEAMRLGEGRRRDLPGETNAWFYEPRGVAAVIAPWNFPLAILCGMTAAAVVTGNTVVMKPAEQSSLIAAELMDAFEQSNCPPGVVNYLPGIGEEAGRELASNPNIALIAFTGSRQVGLAIQQAAVQIAPGQDHVKRVIAEMGGKNAIIVDSDADIDEAIRAITYSAFGYAGQKCSACSRLIVLQEIYDTLMPRLIEAIGSLRVGPAEEANCFVGPVIDYEAFDRINRAIGRAKTEAKLLHGADVGTLADEGFYIGPHVFGNVDPRSNLAQEEIFGPVLAVMKARDLDNAIELANNVPYALTGGFISRSPANIESAARRFRVGNLYINRKITGALAGRQPFGGFKLSGIGSQAGGPDYLLQFMLPRVVTENTLRHGFAP
jgi:RHH-type proline utilization regulon transcriptional repressor/proline dehydrogenase/delta 1-pyrroline-5-carboxylate dehydrogenase